MKHTYVEPGALLDGTPAWRWHCTTCPRMGVWLKDASVVESNRALHEREMHAEKASA